LTDKWYQDWFNSVFYHKLYFDRDENEAKAFIIKLINHLNPKEKSRMVDVACGKGRHSVTLASLGFDVIGIDISPDSIEFAKQFENENLEFFQHDLRLPFRINYFDYVFNFFTSFGYFDTRREHDDAIRTLATSLKKGGMIVFDYLNVHYIEDRLVPSEEKIIGETHYIINRWHDETHFYKKIKVIDPSLTESFEYTEKVAKFSLGDFTEMLSYNRIQVQEVFGDYQLGHYDIIKSPRMIIIGKK
jgi:SAM-dependent methyltransferase